MCMFTIRAMFRTHATNLAYEIENADLPWHRRESTNTKLLSRDALRAVWDCESETPLESTFDILDSSQLERFHLTPRATTLQERIQNKLLTEVIPSPFGRSSVSIIRYKPGDSHTPHYDTNPIGCVVCLKEGNPLQIYHSGWKAYQKVPLEPGEAVVFDGKHSKHFVPPQRADESRLVMVYNFYLPGDCERPSGLDEAVYG